MAVVWPNYETNEAPTGDQALHLVAQYGDGGGAWNGTPEGIDSATWYVVDGIGDQAEDDAGGTTPHSMFGRSQAVSTPNAPAPSLTLNGWWIEGDAGQELIRTAKTSKLTLGYLNLRNWQAGYGSAYPVRVGGGSSSQNASGGLQPVSYTFAPQADPIEVTDFEADPVSS